MWLDDLRPAPEDWVCFKTANGAIKALSLFDFEVISLDHDLGDGGTGYEVLLYIESRVHEDPTWKCPEILLHTANPVGMARMSQAIESINKMIGRPN